MPTLYEDLLAADQEISNWQSDLYVPATEKSKEIFRKHQQAPCYFRSNVDGRWMLEASFQFDPYWQKRAAR